MARICELTGKGPMKGSIIWRSGKSKKSGGIGTHITAITKRRFLPNLQRVKAVVDGEVPMRLPDGVGLAVIAGLADDVRIGGFAPARFG